MKSEKSNSSFSDEKRLDLRFLKGALVLSCEVFVIAYSLALLISAIVRSIVLISVSVGEIR